VGRSVLFKGPIIKTSERKEGEGLRRVWFWGGGRPGQTGMVKSREQSFGGNLCRSFVKKTEGNFEKLPDKKRDLPKTRNLQEKKSTRS